MEQRSQDRQIDYIEFNVGDMARAKDFYGRAFGWTYTDYGPDYCEFTDGKMTGGLTTTAAVRSSGGPLIIFYTADLAKTQQRLTEAGARIIREPYSFPGGRRFHFLDPNGYELAVWSPA